MKKHTHYLNWKSGFIPPAHAQYRNKRLTYFFDWIMLAKSFLNTQYLIRVFKIDSHRCDLFHHLNQWIPPKNIYVLSRTTKYITRTYNTYVGSRYVIYIFIIINETQIKSHSKIINLTINQLTQLLCIF